MANISALATANMLSHNPATTPVPDHPWVGERYRDGHRTLVLGESWNGTFPEAIATDDAYIRAWLAGSLPKGIRETLYPRLSGAVGPSRTEFWNGVAFTNFVIASVGPTRSNRPTEAMYEAAKIRLARVLAELRPARVWVIGKEQSTHSGPVIDEAGIAWAWVRFPLSAPAMTHKELAASWSALQALPIASIQTIPKDAEYSSPAVQTAQGNAECLDAMTPSLSGQYSALEREIDWLHRAFHEYEALYGEDKARIDLLNQTAPRLFLILEDALWGEIFMRLTNITGSIRSAGRDNLTINRLPALCDVSIRPHVQQAVDAAVAAAAFCKEPRNRYYAHRDLNTMVDVANATFTLGSRAQMQDALDALVPVLDAVSDPYQGFTNVFYRRPEADRLVDLIEQGLRSQKEGQ